MYSPKISQEQVERLYKLREAIRATGQKATMAGLVKEALTKYLPLKEKEIKP